MALTSQELATNSRCFDCIPKGMRDAVMIYLLAQLADMTDPQTLVTNARCYDCIPVGLRGAVMMYLQDAILEGGGSGACSIFHLDGTETPEAQAPPSGCGGVAYNDAGDVWTYHAEAALGLEWVKIISA